jgi:GT2 family glycosyltransferase
MMSAPRTAPRIGAVVLNWRTAGGTALAVRALQASARPLDHVLIIDNGSNDGSEDRLRRTLEGAEVVQAGSNLGFSGGCNLGIERALAAGAELVLLANSDVYVRPDCIGRLEAALAAHGDVGIVGPAIVTRGEPDRLESRGIHFSAASGRVLNLGFGEHVSTYPASPLRAVDAVSGALMLIRREVLERVGRLDDAYFFSLEDVDFCLRARRAGFRAACVETAICEHEGSRSIGLRSPRRIYFATRNHLRLTARAPAPLGAPHAAVRQGLVAAMNLAFALTRSPAPRAASLRAFARGVVDHLRGRYGDGP